MGTHINSRSVDVAVGGLGQSGDGPQYSLLGYTTAGRGGTELTITQFASYVDFPMDISIELESGTPGVRLWTPPTPFQRGTDVNFQAVVRVGSVQFLLWFVGPTAPEMSDVQAMLRSLGSFHAS